MPLAWWFSLGWSIYVISYFMYCHLNWSNGARFVVLNFKCWLNYLTFVVCSFCWVEFGVMWGRIILSYSHCYQKFLKLELDEGLYWFQEGTSLVYLFQSFYKQFWHNWEFYVIWFLEVAVFDLLLETLRMFTFLCVLNICVFQDNFF